MANTDLNALRANLKASSGSVEAKDKAGNLSSRLLATTVRRIIDAARCFKYSAYSVAIKQPYTKTSAYSVYSVVKKTTLHKDSRLFCVFLWLTRNGENYIRVNIRDFSHR